MSWCAMSNRPRAGCCRWSKAVTKRRWNRPMRRSTPHVKPAIASTASRWNDSMRSFRAVIVAAAVAAVIPIAVKAAPDDAVARGAYLVRAGGCVSCHTVPGGTPFAGGRALATPFGTFYTPNITPDRQTGIGRWSAADFLRALREGVGPDGANYFPVFPYPSFTRITDEDALAIKAYLFSLPPVEQANRQHDVAFPFSWRFLQNAWKLLFFEPGPFRSDPGQTQSHNRGAYLVTA